MKITSLDINNFRCIKSAKFDFHNRLNVFIGENGAGKSTVLNCLLFCFHGLHGVLFPKVAMAEFLQKEIYIMVKRKQ